MYKWIHKFFNIPEKINSESLEFLRVRQIADNLLTCIPSSRGYELKILKYYGDYEDVKSKEKYDHIYKIHYSFNFVEAEETMDLLAGKTKIEDVVHGIRIYLDLMYNCEITYDKRYLS